ncbi:tetratricopeptide repeat protein [Tolypothrix sp. PCC 7601]|nr:tetratricopeptide repeat protein [Tolypothrix sp. PCC 7601]
MLLLTFPVVATESRTREHKDRVSPTVKLPTPPKNKQNHLQLHPVASQQFHSARFQIAGIFNEDSERAELRQKVEKDLQLLYQTLKMQREKGDRIGEADTLNKIGSIYFLTEEYTKALEFHQQAWVLYEKLGYKSRIAETLGYIGDAYFKIGKYQKVEELFRQKLQSLRKAGDGKGENFLMAVMRKHIKKMWGLAAGCGVARDSEIEERLRTGKISWQEILDISKLNLFIAKELGSPKFNECFGTHMILHGVGWSYRNLGQYSQALDFLRQAIEMSRTYGDRHNELFFSIDLGFVYSELGQYDKALEIIKTTLVLAEKDEFCRCMGLSKLGLVYKEMGQYDKALPVLQEALSMGGDVEKANIFNYIGDIYLKTGKYSQALDTYEQAAEVGVITGEYDVQGFTFNNIGLVHTEMGNYAQALEAYEKSLSLFRQINNHPGVKEVLINIGALLEKQKRPEVAIVFYKEAVNITEEIRQGLRELTHKEQEAYTNKVVGNYRRLADLLLSQGRILEAQQVLELLKIQEIRDFSKDTNTRGENQKIGLSSEEQKLIDKYGSLIAFGQKIYDCKKTNCSQLNELNAQLETLNRQYNQATDSFIVAIRERKGKDDAFFDPRRLSYAQKIVEAQPNTVLIYPFVLPEKIWILWISAGGVVKSVEVPNTGQLQLGKTVLRFRQLIDNQFSDIGEVQATGKQLYDLLIKPVEEELKANKVQNLVFALDSVTRYIPMSALYDGKKYLVENYNISTVLSAELTDTSDRLPIGTQNNPVLALGLSNAVAGFPPLPNVPTELQAIVKTNSKNSKGIFPGLEFLNQDFNRTALRDRLNGRKILHIATHGQFVPNNFLASFILLGTGEKFTVDDVRNLPNLGDVHLVVLSACQTALGDAMQDGVEISSISYYFLNRGAKAVMASLWLVDDQSTSELMKNFYSNLAKGTTEKPITKAEALRQAQLSLLHSKDSNKRNLADPRGGIVPQPKPGVTPRTNQIERNFSHPYYWAPFILIGNGL